MPLPAALDLESEKTKPWPSMRYDADTLSGLSRELRAALWAEIKTEWPELVKLLHGLKTMNPRLITLKPMPSKCNDHNVA